MPANPHELFRIGRLDDAIVSFRYAIHLNPNLPETHNNLCVALMSQGLPNEAIPCFRTALWLKVDLPEAHNNLSEALKMQGQLV